MLGINFDFQIQGSADAIRKLKEIQEGNFETPLAQTGVRLVRRTQQRMRKGLQPDGSPQKPLASYTNKKTGKKHYFREKRKKGWKDGVPIPLVDDGHLWRSVTSNVKNKNELEVGTNVDYGKLHQFGGESQMTVIRKKNVKATKGKNKGKFVARKSNRRNMATAYTKTIKVPARPWLGVSELDQIVIKKVWEDYYKDLR